MTRNTLNAEQTASIRQLGASEARAAGFTTLQWYRAFTLEEHFARIEISNKARRAEHAAEWLA